MSSSVSIKVNVAGRNYPLTVAQKDVELIQNIAKTLDDAVNNLQKNYSVQDKQDLLAMAALQVATKNALNKEDKKEHSQEHMEDLEALLERSNHLV